MDSKAFTRRLRRFVSQFEQDADRVVFEVATDVLSATVENWPVAVDSGVSRAAWRGPVKGQKRLTWRISNPMPYASVIEFGGYPGVGPKTASIGPTVLANGVRVGAGIFPTQTPHAPVRRALAKHQRDIPDKLRQAMRRRWGR